ncbi:MAG: alpha-1,4-glucan--maltose-1-phosphate maltosyltransferase [Leptospiraceae bacterium]|nr:alpha-1,4-glucan--maltose-1-phosphate maltosyltransferase [Leptospiraceae bacterium]MCP5494206.1 alpha-1,4-glucan--maltose-1-phosphate maltosyltransferase [Leptospiraceae bacterium]
MQDIKVRPIIEQVTPEINCGRYPIKRVVGDKVNLRVIIISDGHDELSARVLFKKKSETNWSEKPLKLLWNDIWLGDFSVDSLEDYYYTIEAWVDSFKTWKHNFTKKFEDNQDVRVELQIGISLVQSATKRADAATSNSLQKILKALETDTNKPVSKDVAELAIGDELASLMEVCPDRHLSTRYHKELKVEVDRERAAFSSWYEVFPRSCSSAEGKHGTFQDLEGFLPYISSMGFDVVYLPPIHPIGHTFRKGKNNTLNPEKSDPGVPWAIGSIDGGHKSVHQELGTLEDFVKVVNKAKEMGMEIALDIAFQCSPDHPYVLEHPEWFRKRPDGTIQYAENPPKKYQDIYPFDFESEKAKELWEELKSVFFFWIERGVKIFRVDNPHTKSLYFWKWVISEIRAVHPDVLFLAEAFTRPNIMYHLAKIGYTQSYTYFTWRNTKEELTEYLTELTSTEVAEFYRPNFWPNTPDILHAFLQNGGRAACMSRVILAATMSSNFGIYGPVYELCVNVPREPNSEEYLNSEKYEVRHWDLNNSVSIRPLITKINEIRKNNKALQRNFNVQFYETNNDHLIAYSKHTDDFGNIILVIVNLDPYFTQSGFVKFDCSQVGLDVNKPFYLKDLLTEKEYKWHGNWNFIELNPQNFPAHIFCINQVSASSEE